MLGPSIACKLIFKCKDGLATNIPAAVNNSRYRIYKGLAMILVNEFKVKKRDHFFWGFAGYPTTVE